MADSTETIMMCGDSAEKLKEIKDNSVDMLCSDPPYAYGFMGKKWDQVLPDTEIWRQSYRVLKPGAFITVMAAPRTDVLWRISRDLEEAGFDLSFTNIEWVDHSGFPKATDVSKSLDKRLGGEREVIGDGKWNDRKPNGSDSDNSVGLQTQNDYKETAPSTDIAKKYEGSKAGFQPKPAREIIIVGMKPFSEGSYVDKVLNFEALPDNVKMTYPLIQTPKPAKKEKDFGLSGEEQKKPQRDEGQEKFNVPQKNRPTTAKNVHPTVKPIKLMSYLITLFTRPGDWILDPFGGSGTTGLACKLLDRNHIYIDFTEEYYDIAKERLQVSKEDLKKLLKEKIDNGQQELF
jgi:site-specific DNA-methyltransferase (adenine-specific)